MPAPIPFDNSYQRLPERFYSRLDPVPVRAPALVRVNTKLAEYLGIDPGLLEGERGAQLVAGNRVPEGAAPVATIYAGHQFGQFNPQLGDGRAILLGEVVARDGVRHDLQLKGSGPTPYSRGGDGRSPLGPVLREYVVSEAMAALGVPTTRSLAAATTGEPVHRDTTLPGGVLLRVARSHIRIGTFELFASRRDGEGLQLLLDHVIARHHTHCADAPLPAIELLRTVAQRQAELIAQWQLIGFVHGVMNTDNMLVSGDTIDYGPCAFLDEYDPAKVFSSIDQLGRYAFENQPHIARWNLASLARALLPLCGETEAELERAAGEAQSIIDAFPEWHARAHRDGLSRKLGLSSAQPGDDALAAELLQLMHDHGADFTLTFRHLTDLADPPADATQTVAAIFEPPPPLADWLPRWQARLQDDPREPAERGAEMRRRNPALIPRNHLIEAAIRAAEDRGELARFHALVDALAEPQRYDAEREPLARPPREDERVTRTFCGT